ncbi:MAG: ribosomal-processing cysteine protease Prp [Spirochaetia bacterium]
MIRADLRLDPKGIIKHIEVKGHGAEIACTAVSILLRTLGRILESVGDELKVSVNPEREGWISLAVENYPEQMTDWLSGVTGFVVLGLRDIAEEYPECTAVNISTIQ